MAEKNENPKTIEVGALYAGVEKLVGGVKKFDAGVSDRAAGLSGKLTNYFRKAIDSYEETKK
ncbi:MAG: hypothetical protein HOE48_24875 [Candidatus Latescibacteria bacterium]|jgi:hypothetical protein|nr:hypothetical protein [Candidatus Latescibacterota bacterium]MBT4141166.1 hypothetical protein [Candidatus Latescibacterota bacterium]MBT5831920.1 hypothetical protein [Candidatus Latescibacterota bacterium]